MGQNALRVNGNDIGAHGRGINALEIDKRGNKIKTDNFDTYGSPTTATDALVSFIETAQTGHILLFAINDHGARIEPNGVTKLQELGSKKIDDVAAENDRNNWGFITVKGGHALAERYEPSGDGPVTASVTRPNKFSVAREGTVGGKHNEVGPAPEALIGWWPLDGDTNDHSRNANNGTNNGATITSGLGQSAYSFDGSSSYISVDVGESNSSTWALSCWIRPTHVSNIKHITGIHNQHPDGWTPLSHFGVRDSSITWWDSNGWRDSNATISTGNWYFASIVGTSSTVKTYVDGTIDNTESSNIENNIAVLDTIGRREHNDDRYYEGKIQDVRLYNRALSDAEVAQLYAITNPRQNQQMIQTQDGNVLSKETFDELL